MAPEKRARRRALPALLAALAALAVLWWLLPRPARTADQLGIRELSSPLDADGDGVDDWHDMVRGARDYVATRPRYRSAYFAGGYPDDGTGVCTDVIWQAFRAAGYDLKAMVDADIAAHPDRYGIPVPDGNIDFRRVGNLDRFFAANALTLPCSFDDPEDWQPGDVVVFNGGSHIALCSDLRRADGIPWIIHHGNAIEGALEADQIGRQTVTGHYRWCPLP